jgi:hypothetical protein
MFELIVGILLIVGAWLLWHYGDGSPPLVLLVVALGIVGAVLVVAGLFDLADARGGLAAVAAGPGPLSGTLRRRARRFEKQAQQLRAGRQRAVRYANSETVDRGTAARTAQRYERLQAAGRAPKIDISDGVQGAEARQVRGLAREGKPYAGGLRVAMRRRRARA